MSSTNSLDNTSTDIPNQWNTNKISKKNPLNPENHRAWPDMFHPGYSETKWLYYFRTNATRQMGNATMIDRLEKQNPDPLYGDKY